MDELDKLIEGVVKRPASTGIDSKEFLNLVEQVLDEVYEHQQEKRVFHERTQKSGGSVSAGKTAREFLLTLPKFSPNESWGRPDSLDREVVDKVFNVIGGGATVEEKISFIQKIADPKNKITSPRRIISTLIILESLASVINSFSASAGGFVFEGFISALLRGKQEAEVSAKGNLPIQDLIAFSELGGGTPVSLKLLNRTTGIHGSYSNLVDALDEFGQMIYIIARKDGEEIALEEFILTRDNFIDAITTSARGGATKEAELFRLPGDRDPKKSIRYLNSLDSWPEKFEALQRTAGYRGRRRPATDLDAKESPDESEEEKDIIAKVEEKWGGNIGILPKDYPDKPGEAFDKDREFWSKWFGSGSTANSLIAVMRKKGFSKPSEMKAWALKAILSGDDSIAERRMLEEAKDKSQWTISPAQLPTLKGINYKQLGAIPYSSARIEKIAELHMDKLNQSLFDLFESTKELSDNINNYFTYEARNDAVASGEKAIQDSINIQNSMRQEITSDKKD